MPPLLNDRALAGVASRLIQLAGTPSRAARAAIMAASTSSWLPTAETARLPLTTNKAVVVLMEVVTEVMVPVVLAVEVSDVDVFVSVQEKHVCVVVVVLSHRSTMTSVVSPTGMTSPLSSTGTIMKRMSCPGMSVALTIALYFSTPLHEHSEASMLLMGLPRSETLTYARAFASDANSSNFSSQSLTRKTA
jgi:hypothetical protein